jgi:hypothetical protein
MGGLSVLVSFTRTPTSLTMYSALIKQAGKEQEGTAKQCKGAECMTYTRIQTHTETAHRAQVMK